MILACSGARPAPEEAVPVVGLPEAPEPSVPAPAPLVSRARAGRFDTVRLAPAAPADPLARGPRGLGHRVDLDLSRAPVAEAFRLLAEAANVNVVLGEGIAGEVTLRLRHVTVRDAIRAVAATQDLQAEWRGDILWVRAN